MTTDTLDFEGVMVATQTLLTQATEQTIPGDEITATLTQLLTGPFGGRGFFAVYLTLAGEETIADNPTVPFLEAFAQTPEVVAELLVKNLAMSTAMVVFHHRMKALEQAAGSEAVQRRCRGLIQILKTPPLQDKLQEMATSLSAGQGSYASFLDRWQYDGEQRGAIALQVQEMLTHWT
jgi:hypothetical protein